MRTFGGTPADVVASIDEGEPVPGSQLTIWTDPIGTQITDLYDTDGTTKLPGYVTAGPVGEFSFKTGSDTYSIVWAKDVEGRFWELIAREVLTELVEIAEAWPTVVEAANAAVEAVESITPVDAKAAGLIPDVCDEETATANVQLLNALLATTNVYIPAGNYCISQPVRVPSYRTLTGAGIGLTWLKLIDGVPFDYPVVTNAGNVYAEHTTPDVHIRIADISLDGNRDNRDETTGSTWGARGCCVQLACVEHAQIERVEGFMPRSHCFDISASVYRNSGPAVYAVGPSKYVVLRDCVGDKGNDDCYTTHHSQFLWFDNCVAYCTSELTAANQNGFEIDDGSLDVVLTGCYSYGFNAAYQVKGHHDAPPARRVSFVDCVADNARYGFEIVCLDRELYDGSQGPLPTDYDFACDVQVTRCKIYRTRPVFGTTQLTAMVNGYNDVHFTDLLVYDSPPGFIRLAQHCNRITFDGVNVENSYDAPSAASVSDNRGMISIGTSQEVAGDDITIRNIRIRDDMADGLPIVSVGPDYGERIVIDGVRGTSTGPAAVRLPAFDPSWTVKNVHTDGYTADIHVETGDFAGDWTEQVTARDTYGKAAPTTGTWNTGDRCWKISPSAGTAAGWICITAGTPGTWKTFATLTA